MNARLIVMVLFVLITGLGSLAAVAQEGQPSQGDGESAESLFIQLALQMKEDRIEEAIVTAKQILALPRTPDQDLDAAVFQNLLATLCCRVGKLDESLTYATEAYQAYQKGLGEDHNRTVDARASLGSVLTEMGRFSEAEPHLLRVLEFHTKTAGAKSTEAAYAHLTLARFYQNWGRLSVALQHAEASEEAFRVVAGEKEAATAAAMNRVGIVLSQLGDYEPAREKIERAMQIYRELYGEESVYYADTQSSLALLLEEMGELSVAREQAEQALERNCRLHGPNRPITAKSYNNLGMICEALADFDQASDSYLKALKIQEEILGAEHPDTAHTYSNLAGLCRQLNMKEAAESYFCKAVNADAKCYGLNSPVVAIDLHNYGGFLLKSERYDEAAPLLEQALKVGENVFGVHHPRTAMTRLHIGMLNEYTKRVEAAEKSYTLAVNDFRQSYGPHHPKVGLALSYLATITAMAGRFDLAADYFDQSRRIYQAYISRELLALPEKEQIAFLFGEDQDALQLALSLPLADGVSNDLVARSADWVINGKATSYRAVARRSRLQRVDRESTSFALLRQLQDARQQLAGLTMYVPRPEERESYDTQVREVSGKVDGLIRELGRREQSSAAGDSWIGVDQVRQALADDMVLVEFAQVSVKQFQAGPPHTENRYVAWVIPPAGAGKVAVVDLGAAEAIDAALSAVRETLAASGGPAGLIASVGENAAAAGLRPKLDVLSKLVLHPLLPHLEDRKNWLLSPDSSLWLVPWDALTVPNGQYAVENHQITYLLSSRELLAPETQPPFEETRAVAFVAPDFDLTPGQVATGSERYRTDNRFAQRGAAERSKDFVSRRWAYLEGAARLVQTIAPQVKRAIHTDLQLYQGADALEAAFRSVSHPRVLIFETHAFFLDDERVCPQDARDSYRQALVVANPLLRCGLVLAGANRRRERADSKTDDGILTGMEIVDADLSGCELVVLGACDTGLGRVVTGQGVAGLRQAFHIAGAKRVIASLWKVSDQQTAELMQAFWAHKANGLNSCDALRQAKIDWIDQRRKQGIEPHPNYWAAFTITGSPDKTTSTSKGMN
jgi:CHAT domain-containing protein/tetratricopeptide (TPR) repeat protein